MIDLHQWSLLAGGIGLFLLGMGLMTDGLRQAAGAALKDILTRSTRTRVRALASGFAATALVQSSSAVTVAAIGFVNAGLLALGPVLWVLFGSNVGTTVTGWLVAVLGLKIKIDALALPLLAAGMLLRLTGPGTRRGGWGLALAGFGVLFLGIAMLRDGFGEVAAQVQLPQGGGLAGIAALIGVGIVLTVLMQSSSAAMALVLTAAQGGLMDLPAAAAVVVGTNIGTTVTAVIAAIGATSNARRAAAAHVLFNVIAAVAALAALPLLLAVTRQLAGLLGDDGNIATALALFHTLFNVLGVLLMWPLADRLGEFLLRRFRTAEEDAARPRYLDAATAQVPALGVEALSREVSRFGSIAVCAAADLAGPATAQADALARAQLTLGALDAAIDEFVVRLNRSGMAPETARRLAAVLRRNAYFGSVAEQLEALAVPALEPAALAQAALDEHGAMRREGAVLLRQLDPQEAERDAAGDAERAAADAAATDRQVTTWDERYGRAKASLLDAAAAGHLMPDAAESLLRSNSALRRAVQQAHKAHIAHRSQQAKPSEGPSQVALAGAAAGAAEPRS
jgi:phosphate:Na+ symporter